MNLRIPAYILVALLSGYLTYIFVPLVKKYCFSKGLLDQPGPRKIHQTPTPRLGGVAFIASFMIATFLGFIANPSLWANDWVSVAGIFGGGMIIFLLGLTDDLRDIGPSVK